MAARSLSLDLLATTLAFGALVACANQPGSSDAPVNTADQAILDGVTAADAKYGAVGALLVERPWGLEPICSGTLVAPTAVVTAKHCTQLITKGEQAYFGFGVDMFEPTQILPITGVVEAPDSKSHPGLLLKGGRDVAVAYLEAAPEGIVPAKLGLFTHCMLGKQFEIAGYGILSGDGFPADWGMYGMRFVGPGTARALAGNWYNLLFNGNKNAYLDWYWADAVTSQPSSEQAQTWWHAYKLEPGYELLAAGLQGEATGCYGDSGGPLLRGTSASDLTVYGVNFATEASQANVCDLGNAYLVFNQEILGLVKAAIALQ